MPRKKKRVKPKEADNTYVEEKIHDENVIEDTDEVSHGFQTQLDVTKNWSERISGALFFLFVGGMLLLNSLGIVSWNVWGYILKFWPLLIILVALQIILGKSKISGCIMGVITFLKYSVIGIVALLAVGTSATENINLPD